MYTLRLPLRNLQRVKTSGAISHVTHRPGCWRRLPRYSLFQKQCYASSSPADNPGFESILDRPPQLVRSGRRRHGLGLVILSDHTLPYLEYARANLVSVVAIPITAFALGTWQVQRLEWKTSLIAKYEDRLVRHPLPLPPVVDPNKIDEFDYRRVTAKGRYRHDQEMLVGPRTREGENGYQVITPLERPGGASKILINRGWISKRKRLQADRRDGLPEGDVTVQGLLRSPWKKNMFTPENQPLKNEFYFPDIEQMAKLVDAQPVWIERTMGVSSEQYGSKI